MPKATNLEYDQRIETARQMILSGLDASAICRDMTSRFEVSTRQAERYVSEAHERLKERFLLDRAALFAEHIAHRRDMRYRARRAKDLRMELAVAQDEAKLLGLYSPEEVHHDVTGSLSNVLIYMPDNGRGEIEGNE